MIDFVVEMRKRGSAEDDGRKTADRFSLPMIQRTARSWETGG